jgi:hypothetical protein
MTFRITTGEDAGGHVVRLAGRLGEEGAAELGRVLASLSGPVRVDCEGLRSADEAGLEALRALVARGIRLTGLSKYWELRLKAGRLEPPPAAPPRGDPAPDNDRVRDRRGGDSE